eukprot:4396484-Alexandrium_andersonii.AAC.1
MRGQEGPLARLGSLAGEKAALYVWWLGMRGRERLLAWQGSLALRTGPPDLVDDIHMKSLGNVSRAQNEVLPE